MSSAKPLYLDYAATTPVRDEVRAAMAPYFTDVFGNPSSMHRWGRAAYAALEEARASAAASLGARASEIHFVRGGTESDNLAVLGSCRRITATGTTPTVAITAIEHHAVLESAQHAAREGVARLVVIGVTPDGEPDWDALGTVLADPPAVISMMWVSNETGIVQEVPKVARMAVDAGAVMHSDAVQAVGKVPVHVEDAPVALLTVTGHKIYGPKGTGLLFVREGTELEPLLRGGGQERALRPGTEDVAGAAGLATALKLAVESQAEEAPRLLALREGLEARLTTALDGIRVNGADATRAPHITSLGLEGVDGQALLMALDLEGIAASGGSACASGSTQGSHVIAALYGADDPLATVRFSLGRQTNAADIERAAETIIAVVRRMREAA